MALVSPGVEVTIIDQSQYLPAPTNSVPFVLLATAQDKRNPNGTGIAEGTTAANAGKLYQITSQRELVTTYGNPFFYTSTDGTPLQGYELNEYGLLAAYSALGVTNNLYALRADIDLASLVGSSGRPTGDPADGTYWLDATTSTWGIYEFNATTGAFTLQDPLVITDIAQMSGGVPIASLGAIGDYAVWTQEDMDPPTAAGTFFYKSPSNAWVEIGNLDWYTSVPAVIGTETNPTLTVGNTFTITTGSAALGTASALITVAGGGLNNAAGIAAQINALGWGFISAQVVSGRLNVYVSSVPSTQAPPYVQFTTGTGTVLTDLGIPQGQYYQPAFQYGTSAQQPAWAPGQFAPRPTGSVWVKIGSAGNGLLPVVNEYSAAAASWISRTVNLGRSDWAMNASLDATGGKAIPEGTIFAEYSFNQSYAPSPVYFKRRVATGPTIITGTNTSVNLTSGPYYAQVQVSLPGSSNLSPTYNLNVPDNSDAVDFVTAWAAAAIPYTTASVTTDGAIQLVHTEGGVIVVNDATAGLSNGLMENAGFDFGSTGVTYGPGRSYSVNASQTSTSGIGTNFELNVTGVYNVYIFDRNNFVNSGAGYAIGDTITIAGTSLGGTSPGNDLELKVTSISGGGVVTAVAYASGAPTPVYTYQLTNWDYLTYTANEGAPTANPANLTNWFYTVVDQVDIMVNYGGAWKGYKNQQYNSNGFPTPTLGGGATDPNGPIVSASEPTTQSNGDPLVYGDLWISTADLENYPIIYRWQAVDGSDQWVLVDTTDQVNPEGCLFADARWSSSGAINPVDDPIPTIASLLTSNYVDLDAPSPSLYPTGMLLFNTRRSGYNVKQFRTNYFTGQNYPNAGAYNGGDPTNINNLPQVSYTWVSASGLQSNGKAYMGRKAQRAMVVAAMRAAIDSNSAIRDEDNFFNLQAAPYYPELQPNMVALNSDRGETSYILGDTPMGLPESATLIQAWATNAAGATSTGEEGCVTRNTYLGLFYPSGIAPEPTDGNLVAVPPSHMMLRTFLRNDTVAYPWLAAAGTRRGIIDNATAIGYLDRDTGEFQVMKTNLGIRNTLYLNFINPLVFFTGNGLLNYGNKTSFNSQSALDRTNVARLVAYIRRQLTIAARPFVFEPNDALTRQQIAGVVESLMVDLVAKRGLYDYLVVCDESNNTPARIDRNELWIDVAVEPVKAAEFIYIPVRILNTGELSGA